MLMFSVMFLCCWRLGVVTLAVKLVGSWGGKLGVWASQVMLEVKNLPANARDRRDMGSIPGSGRSPGERHSNPFQYSRLENAMNRGVWQAAFHRFTQESNIIEAT